MVTAGNAIYSQDTRMLNRYTVSALLVALLTLLTGSIAHAQGIPILVYHRFSPNKAGPTTVRTRVFEEQLVWLNKYHYHVVPLRKAVDVLRGNNRAIDLPAVAITADDGHASVYTEMWPLIQRYRIPVTLFIYPSAISNASYALTWEQLRTMQESGLVDIESHTYWHPNLKKERARLSTDQYRALVDLQLGRSRDVLGSKTGKAVDMLAWPFGIVDKELEEAASRAGYISAFAYTGGPAYPGCDLLAISRIPVSDEDLGTRFAALLQANSTGKAKNHE